MPEQETLERAREDAREGKSPSTQAGEFVREEIHHVREGKHGAKSAKQVIAIDARAAKRRTSKKSATRSRATTNALKREPRSAASHPAVSRQAKTGAAQRGKQSRKKAAMKSAHTRKAA